MKDWFILKKLEIFNWWTFSGDVETYYLDWDITVVSGDNWSGKSTLVDAFVSLFVPARMRKYNLSATEWSKKKSRNELSYIRWAYANKETENWVETAYLRWNKVWESTFSVLLWYFKDENSNREVTLSTFFRTTSTWIDKFFIVSEQELYLKQDFLEIINKTKSSNPITKLKTSLKAKTNTNIFSKFVEYVEVFSSIFGLRQNAIELFNKVVSLKEIKDLNSFFRENMLEKNPDILKEFDECEKNYLWVKDIYEKIIMSEEKLKILSPFMEIKKSYDAKMLDKQKVLYFEQNFKNYSYVIENWLISVKIKENTKDLEIIKIDKTSVEDNIHLETNEVKSIEKLLEDSDTTKRIKEIEGGVLLLQKEEWLRELNHRNYENFIEVLNKNSPIIPVVKGDENRGVLTEEKFQKNKSEINNKKQNLDKENIENEKKNIEYFTNKNDLDKELNISKNDLKYYQKRQNLLPERLSNIRKKICQRLGIEEKKLKFVCELIKVKKTEKSWIMPIEKLLHSFALEMLVPEELLKQVNDFVDSNNLKWKLKYNKVFSNNTYKSKEIWENYLISKLDIKHNNEFENWIKDKITTRFNYLCLNDNKSELYDKSSLVLTLSGLIKNKFSYVKDDREFSVKNYILGWDNKEKILLLEKQITNLDKKILKIKQNLEKILKIKQNYETFLRIYSKFEDIKTFTQIDYISLKNEIKEKNKEIINLKENDSELKTYREKLEIHKTKLIKFNTIRDKQIGKISNIDSELKKLNKRKNQIESSLKNINITELIDKFKNSKYNLVISNLENLSQTKEEILEKIISKKDRINEEITSFSNKMNGYSSSYREHKMTISEKNELQSNISTYEMWKYLEKEFHKINDEELYKYKEKFEKEFRETLFIRLNDFYNSLENEADYIKWKIETINKTLKTINYSKETFIEVALKSNNKKTDWIEEFKQNFRDKVVYKKELDMTDKMSVFEDIKDFMEDLINKDNETWRDNKIDVRNWFLFNIKENYRTDNSLKDIFESSSGKSWGQTIKLAYSVLAAALLYQYGIKDESESLMTNSMSKSFRLVVIDEVFAKLDIDNSKYVLDLFKTLGLQLFIITPTNTINVLEDYVQTIYFIANPDWNKSFKNKLDIKSRTLIEEKIKKKPENKAEKEFMKNEENKKADLEDMRREIGF